MTTITAGSTTVELTDNLLWTDEHQWAGAARSATPSLTGAVLMQVSARPAGRPITLEQVVMPRADLDTLKALESDPTLDTFTLTLPGGDSHTVAWRQEGDEAAIRAEPYFPLAPDVPGPDTPYICTLRFIEV